MTETAMLATSKKSTAIAGSGVRITIKQAIIPTGSKNSPVLENLDIDGFDQKVSVKMQSELRRKFIRRRAGRVLQQTFTVQVFFDLWLEPPIGREN